VYESIPRSVIITLGRQLYRIPEVAPPTIISLIPVKQFSKVISHTGKFILFVICAHNKKKVAATFVTSTQRFSLKQKKVEGIEEEYKDIFSSPTEVPMHCQVRHPIDLTPGASIPNGPVYHFSLMENDEIRHHIHELLQNGHIRPNSSPCKILILLV
jgi:hypothetical protein